jgi:NADH:ubiquinone oxidoreductase subunit 3 (subunit A)
METVRQSDRDKELASMNVNGLQKLINELNTERDQLYESVKELDTAQGVDSNLKVEYRSQHIQYMVFFVVTIIVVAILFRIQTSQESGAMELVVLVASVLFMIYHFSGWIKAAAAGFWHWLNGLFNF